MSESRPYLDPYLAAAQAHGPGFEALLWHSPRAQRTRFRVLSKMANLAGRTVADIGCGNADLLLDLDRRGRTPARYIGVDAVPATLAHAKAQTAHIPGAEFIDHDFVQDTGLPSHLVASGVDTVLFCGSLNTLPQCQAQDILDRFWNALAGRPKAVLLFNFLSLRHDAARTPANPPAVRFEPIDMLTWALDRTPLTTFRHDYLNGHDATICMRTPPARV
jgi:SAM-dependent methyltransferase